MAASVPLWCRTSRRAHLGAGPAEGTDRSWFDAALHFEYVQSSAVFGTGLVVATVRGRRPSAEGRGDRRVRAAACKAASGGPKALTARRRARRREAPATNKLKTVPRTRRCIENQVD